MKLINIIIAACIMITPVYGVSCVQMTEEKYPITLSEELIEYTKQTAEEYDLDYRLVLAVMYYESRFTEHIYNYNKTCVGLMQVTIRYKSWLAEKTEIEDLNITTNSKHNISAGVWMLSNAFSNTENTKYALMIYNRGAAGAAKYMNENGTYNTYAKDVYKIYKEYCKRLDK